MGKGGVGKSSTVNSLIGERVVAVSAFQVCSILDSSLVNVVVSWFFLFFFLIFCFFWGDLCLLCGKPNSYELSSFCGVLFSMIYSLVWIWPNKILEIIS